MLIQNCVDQGQGGGMAMEDAASIGVVLPLGTRPEEVPERLQLYQEIRKTRADRLQEYTRQAGLDYKDGKPVVNSKSLVAILVLC